MSWQGVTVMDQRVRFIAIAEYLKGYFPFSELCFQFNSASAGKQAISGFSVMRNKTNKNTNKNSEQK